MVAIKRLCVDAGAVKTDSSLLLLDTKATDAQVVAWLSSKAKQKNGLEEVLEPLSAKQIAKLVTNLNQRVTAWIAAVAAADAAEASDVPASPDADDAPSSAAVREALQGLQLAATLARAALHVSKAAVPATLAALVTELHENALLCMPEHPDVQEAVSKLCYDYWCAQAPGRDCISIQLVPYMFLKAVNGRAADVKRAHALRDALPLFDYDSVDSDDLVEILCHVTMSPTVLRCPEGRRLLAALFNLNHDLIAELTMVMKNQIVTGQASLLDAYAEVVFKAWRDVKDELRPTLEQDCIQPLMLSAILAASPRLAASLRRVLRGVHEQKSHKGVDAMLHRLYEAILWRHMKAANPEVRCNALAVLFDAFPIQDPALTNEQIEEAVTKQLTLMKDALRDPAPKVRATATAGVCALLDAWWELLPAHSITHFMVALQDSAFDGAAPTVRVALLEGLASLVNNPQAQKALAVMLPRLQPLMFDPSVRVRQAMALLLERVGLLRSLRWWDVVPAAQVLAVLGSDVPGVVLPLQRLVIPTVLPRVASGAVELEACAPLMQLLRDNPSAGSAFCRLLAADSGSEASVPPESLHALARTMLGYLLDCTIAPGTPPAAEAPAAPAKATSGEQAVRGAPVKKTRQAGKAAAKRKGGPAAQAPDDGAGEGESDEAWTNMAWGVHELLCAAVDQIRGAAATAAASKAKPAGRGGGRGGGRRTKAVPPEASAAVDVSRELDVLLPAGSLVAWIRKAPSVAAVRAALRVASHAAGAVAAAEAAELCSGWLAAGAATLPGVDAGAGLVFDLNALPIQGEAQGKSTASVDLVCEAASMLVAAGHVDDLLAALATALTGANSAAGVQVPLQRGAGCKGSKQSQPHAGGDGLQVRGALAVLAVVLHVDGGAAAVAASAHAAALVSALTAVVAAACSEIDNSAAAVEAGAPTMLPAAAAALCSVSAMVAAASSESPAEAARQHIVGIQQRLVAPLVRALALDPEAVDALQQNCHTLCEEAASAPAKPEAPAAALAEPANKRQRKTAPGGGASPAADALIRTLQLALSEALHVAELSSFAREPSADKVGGALAGFSAAHEAALGAVPELCGALAGALAQLTVAQRGADGATQQSEWLGRTVEGCAPLLASALDAAAAMVACPALQGDEADGVRAQDAVGAAIGRALECVDVLLCCTRCLGASGGSAAVELREVGRAALALACAASSTTPSGEDEAGPSAGGGLLRALLCGATLPLAASLPAEPFDAEGAEQGGDEWKWACAHHACSWLPDALFSSKKAGGPCQVLLANLAQMHAEADLGCVDQLLRLVFRAAVEERPTWFASEALKAHRQLQQSLVGAVETHQLFEDLLAMLN